MGDFGRRGFLEASAIAAAGSLFTKHNRAVAAGDTLNVALIGAGGQGQRIFSYCLKNPGVRGVAVCDLLTPNFEAANKLAGGAAKRYLDWKEMLDKEQIDAVLIGLPEHLHCPATVDSLKAGKHVFCEKPMAYTLDEGKEMIRAAKATGKVLQVGQQRRCNPLYYMAAQQLQDKKIVGDIVRIDAFWDRWGDWKRQLPPGINDDFSKWGYPSLNHLVNWRLFRKYGHGLMTENGTHQMDASGWLLGNKKPTLVNGVGVSQYRDGRETHDVCVANYIYEGDVVVRFSQDFHQGFNYDWDYGELVLGSHGSLRLTNQSEVVFYPKQNRAGKKQLAPSLVNGGQGFELPGIKMTAAELDEVPKSAAGYLMFGYEAEMRSFVHCCRNNATPPCTAEIGHNSIVPTIVGTEAQFENRVIKFEDSWWA